jgi:hypothetical protein
MSQKGNQQDLDFAIVCFVMFFSEVKLGECRKSSGVHCRRQRAQRLRRYSARPRRQRTLRAAGVAVEQSRVGPAGEATSRTEEREGRAEEASEECTHGRGRGEAGHAPEHGGGSRTDLGLVRVERSGGGGVRAHRDRRGGARAGGQSLRRWTGQWDRQAGPCEREREREGERQSPRLRPRERRGRKSLPQCRLRSAVDSQRQVQIDQTRGWAAGCCLLEVLL